MRTETKILLTAIRNACKHDQRIDDFLKGFTMQIPLPIMKAKLDENADILGVVLTELYNEMTNELSKQQEQPPASADIEEQLDESGESEVPTVNTTVTTTAGTATTGDDKFTPPASTIVNPTQILIESMEEKLSKKKKSKSNYKKSEE